VFGKANGSVVNLSDIADASNPTGGFVINGEAANDYSGGSVSSAGDVNGDGLDDLIVGAYGANPNGINSGKSYIIFGKTDTDAIDLQPLLAFSAPPLITKPPIGLLASALTLRLMALLLPNTT
jgi:hypothetical protein